MIRCLCAILLLSATCLASEAQVGELPRSTPQQEGVDSNLINRFCQVISSLPDVDLHHLMILRYGKVIGEMHAAPYKASDLHVLYSASKTVTGLAIGIAIDDGLLSVDDKVSKFLRDKMPPVLSPALDSLTVRHLLMMAAGRDQDFSIFEGDKDWLSTWFKGLFAAVGKEYKYDSMCTHALATIVTRLTGKPMQEFVKERIFDPLHITEADWELAPDGVEAAGWGLRLQAESQAKLGLLMLYGGKWNGQQLVSEQWVHDMTQCHLGTKKSGKRKLSVWQRILKFMRTVWHTVRSWFTGYNVDDYFLGYGYQTKAIIQPRAQAFFAAGYGGQLIHVVPKLDLVLVINGRASDYGDEVNAIYDYLVEPMVSGEDVVPTPAPDSLKVEMPLGNPTHPLEQQLFSQSIVLEENLMRLNSIEVRPMGDDRVFTMYDYRGPLRAIAACGQWRFTTSDERPIYIMESREQLVGTKRPFTSIAAYAWQGDTLAMRLDWLDGGDNRRLKMTFDGDDVTVWAIDNFDALYTDTIHGKLQPAHERYHRHN